MRIIPVIAAVAALLLPCAADAADCGKLLRENTVQMIPQPGPTADTSGPDLVPVMINGIEKRFVLDSSWFFTMIAQPVADELKLPTNGSYTRITNLDNKQTAAAQVKVKNLAVGLMRGVDQAIPIMPVSSDYDSSTDGVVALYQFESGDVDLDFGHDKMNVISPDHCPGQGLYWTAPVVATLPLSMYGTWITFPALLDGHEVKAILSTGHKRTYVRRDIAEHYYGLTMGSDDTPASGELIHDSALQIYQHRFKSLSLGEITINDLQMDIMPFGGYVDNDRRELVGDRTKSERDLNAAPEVSVGMDVLHQLHLYIAFKEHKLYISKAAASAK
jgi:hypothetical protein